MAQSKSGEKVGMYFDRDLWSKISEEADKLRIKPTELIRMILKRHFDSPLLEEVEKLQTLSSEMFKFMANKFSHIELTSSLAKSGVDAKNIPKNILNEQLEMIKNHNVSQAKKIIEDVI